MSKPIIERRFVKGEIIESDQSKLPNGVTSRVRYPICEIGQKNHNGRIYEMDVWNNVFENEEVQQKLQRRNLFGNQEHPEDSKLKLNKDETSHIVSNMYADGNTIKADLDVLPTDAGRFIQTLLDAGCEVGVSTRAEGELEECVDEQTGEKFQRVVPEAYKFITVDFTADPSTLTSYPEDVKRNVMNAVQKGYESRAINSRVACALLESLNTKEARRLEDMIMKPKNFDTGTDVLHEGKVAKIKHVFSRSNKYIIETQGEKDKVVDGVSKLKSIDEAVEIVGNEKKCPSCMQEWSDKKIEIDVGENKLVNCASCGDIFTYNEAKLKEAMKPKIVEFKAGDEVYQPHLESEKAKQVFSEIADYVMLADDPQYNKIVRFRRNIMGLQNTNDIAELKKYFESEFAGMHTKDTTAWDYYADYDESVYESDAPKDEIDTAAGKAKFVKTETEDEYGNWNQNYNVADGYYVIHAGPKHHVYKLEKVSEEVAVATDDRISGIADDFEDFLRKEGIRMPTSDKYEKFTSKYNLNPSDKMELTKEFMSRLGETIKEAQRPKTLEDWRASIEEEVPYVDEKPFSHNIISLALSAIDKQFGREEANKAIVDFGLEDLGWSKLEESAPPGAEYVVKGLKKEKNVNPYALAWSMRNKGDKFRKGPHAGKKMSSVGESVSTFNFEDMLKEMKKVKILDALPEKQRAMIVESKTTVELVENFLKAVRESVNDYALLKAELDKASELFENRTDELEKNYITDMRSYKSKLDEANKKIEESKKSTTNLSESINSFEQKVPLLEGTVKKQQNEIKEIKQSHVVEITKLKESHSKELKEKLTSIVEETTKSTSEVAKRQIDEIKSKYEKEINELKSSYAKEKRQLVIETKLHENNLMGKLPKSALVLLEQAKDEEIDDLIYEFKYAIKEGMFHHVSGVNVEIKDEPVEETEQSRSLKKTEDAVKFLNS